MGEKVDRSIIGLSLSVVGHRNFDCFATLSPDISTHITPQQMTLIFKQNNQFTVDYLFFVLLYFF